MNLLVFVPGAAALLLTALEMPRKAKRVFFKIPVWISSSAIAVVVGIVGRGVLASQTGFITELILFPGLHMAKKHFLWSEARLVKKGKKKPKEVKKMEPDFIIKVGLNPGDQRVCDYCNTDLVDGEATVTKECHSTEYGLMCSKCLGSIKPISSHKEGENVANETWYKEGIIDES